MGTPKRFSGIRDRLSGLAGRMRGADSRSKLAAVRGRLALKLICGFAVVLALTVVIGWLGLNVADKASTTTNQVVHENLNELGDVTEADRLLSRNRESLLEFLIANDPLRRAGLETALADSDRTIEAFIAEEAEGSGAVPDETAVKHKEIVDRLARAWAEYTSRRDSQTLALVATGDIRAARETISGGVGQQYALVESALHQLEALERAAAGAKGVAAQDTLRRGRYQVIAGLAIAAALGLAVAVWLSGRISRSVGAVAGAAEGIAEGDLSRRVDVTTGDEIEAMANAFNSMAERLQAMVEADRAIKDALESAVREYSAFATAVARGDLSVRVATNGSRELSTLTDNLNNMVTGLGTMSNEVLRGAQSLGAAAGQILETVSEQSATVTEQSAAISQTSVTVEQLRASAEQAAQRALEVADQAQESVQVSADGTEVVSEIVRRMEDIKERVEAIAQNILTLSEQTQQISDVTSTVDDISEQSNLLALNATIEAARAGEHGKGFAVVAAEVRNLAEQSKQGTAQVRNILSDIQKATNSAVMATEHGLRVVEDGRGLAHRAGEAIRQLAHTIQSTAQSAKQISAAAQQQSLAVDQIAESMTDINQAAGQFVTGVGESKSAAQGLNDLAHELQALTEQYKV
ncbi:MAG: methyl-accepting chemotaxis protein [Actinomycetota bacterium]